MKSLRELFVLYGALSALRLRVALQATVGRRQSCKEPSPTHQALQFRTRWSNCAGPAASSDRTDDSGQIQLSRPDRRQIHRPRYRQRLHRRAATEISKSPARPSSIYQLTIEATVPSAQRRGRSQQSFGSTRIPIPMAARSCWGRRNLQALSDDPDELSQQLQAMAGPARVPKAVRSISTDSPAAICRPSPPFAKSGSIRIRFPPNTTGRASAASKSSPSRARIAFHGQAFFQYNDQYFNSRSPLYTQSSSLPPYKNLFFGGNVTGPIKKNKASFTLDFERRDITENAFILATDLNASLLPQTINQALLTPQTRTTIDSARRLRDQRQQYPCGAFSRCSDRSR